MKKAAASKKTPPAIEGLPAGAVVEDDIVYFVYRREAEQTETFERDYLEQRFQKEWREERDEIGMVKDGKFKANDYYRKWKPTTKRRPVHRWKSPYMRQKGYNERYADWSSSFLKLDSRVPADFDQKFGQLAHDYGVGFTGYAADQLWTNGLVEAIVCGAYEGDADAAADLMNLVLGLWPKAAVSVLSAAEAARVACDYADQRYIGRAPFADGVRPLLTRASAKAGFLQRFTQARADMAAGRDTMILVDGRRGLAILTAVGEPEILGVRVFEPPKAWTADFLTELAESLDNRWTPVYCLRGTMTAEDYAAVYQTGRLYVEAQWPSPIVDGCKKEFERCRSFRAFVLLHDRKIAPAVTFPGTQLGKETAWFQYTVVEDEMRGHNHMVRQLERCEDYLDELAGNPALPCPEDLKPWIVRSKAGKFERNNKKLQTIHDDWRWETIAGPCLRADEDVNDVLRLWLTAESLREPLEEMMNSLEKESGLVFTDAVTPEKEAAGAVAALGAVILLKFRRQCDKLERVSNKVHYGDDDFFLWDSDFVYQTLRGLSFTKVVVPEDRDDDWGRLELCVNDDVVDAGYALGMSDDFFGSVEKLMEMLSPTFLKDVARRFADPVKPVPARPFVTDPAAFTDPVALDRLDDYLTLIDRTFAKTPLCLLFAHLAAAVKEHWGVSEKTMASRLMKGGYPAEEAAQIAQRLALATTVAKRFATKLKGEPLSLPEIRERRSYMDRYVLCDVVKAWREPLRIILSALACAVEAIPTEAIFIPEAENLSFIAHELVQR